MNTHRACLQRLAKRRYIFKFLASTYCPTTLGLSKVEKIFKLYTTCTGRQTVFNRFYDNLDPSKKKKSRRNEIAMIIYSGMSFIWIFVKCRLSTVKIRAICANALGMIHRKAKFRYFGCFNFYVRLSTSAKYTFKNSVCTER